MDIETQIQTSKRKDYMVVKSNQLIQKSRFKLSLPEQKTVAFICSMIKPVIELDTISKVPYQLEYEFDIREYCRVCAIDYDNGKNYADVKRILKGLRDKSMWLELPDGSETTAGWLAKAQTNKGSGIAHIRLDEDLVPYLFNLQERFTAYRLLYIAKMKSQFSPRMYEILRSYAWQKKVTIDLEVLKKVLMVESVKSYQNFKDFRKWVLEPAISEINEFTDLQVSYNTVTKGRKVIKIAFSIKDIYKTLVEQLPWQTEFTDNQTFDEFIEEYQKGE